MSGKANNGYPFVSRREVAQRIASEPRFAVECVRLVDERRGWMASHRTKAAHVAARITAGDLSAEDLAEVVTLISQYARTLSRIMRERELAERPELLASAAIFGIIHPTVLTETTTPVEAARVAVVDTISVTEPPVVVPKRRGRPPGSKSKKSRSEIEHVPKRRRRS